MGVLSWLADWWARASRPEYLVPRRLPCAKCGGKYRVKRTAINPLDASRKRDLRNQGYYYWPRRYHSWFLCKTDKAGNPNKHSRCYQRMPSTKGYEDWRP